MDVVDIEVDKVADEVANMVVDMEVNKVADVITDMVVKIPNEDFTVEALAIDDTFVDDVRGGDGGGVYGS